MPNSIPSTTPSERAKRLERMWSGEFGQSYTLRNSQVDERAGRYHNDLCQRLRVKNVLEVGCNLGLNLTHIDRADGVTAVGIDINPQALQLAQKRLDDSKLVTACAYQLPFPDDAFDLVFTCGVLIHLCPDDLPLALGEIGRVSRRFVWIGEYAADELTEVPYRGMDGALFKCDFGRMAESLNPQLSEIEHGFLAKGATPFDDLTWWLFEQTGAEVTGP